MRSGEDQRLVNLVAGRSTSGPFSTSTLCGYSWRLMENVGRLNAEARIVTGDADGADESLDSVRDDACEWAFKTMLSLRVEIAEFEVE